ncbi:MAG: glycosyltransferase [Acidimicrobiia bacterium]|nr:glycosyltransferase [Acidimicrobiia bacterium]MCY4457596.1 glycosyltransferase [Acidimicrobiaceae bacterium]
MATLSIISAMSPDLTAYFDEVADSVNELRREAQFTVDWVLCVDGLSSQTFVGPDRIIHNPEPCGVAVARNIALSRAVGDAILPLDADDLLVVPGIIRMMEELSTSAYKWIAANRISVDGGRTPHWIEQRQTWHAGELSPNWTTPFVFHPNCVMTHRSLALAVGGWPALRTNEDLAFVFALSRISAGCAIANVMLKYRSWSGQITKSPTYFANKRNAFHYIEVVENQWRKANSYPTIKSPIIEQIAARDD